MKRTERKNKKTLLALLVLLVAIAIIIGSSLAFFTDIISSNIQGTAGTLGIEMGTITKTQYYSKMVSGTPTAYGTALAADNLNPGDYILLDFEVESLGTKSAWVRANVGAITGKPSDDNKNTPPTSGEITAAFKLFAIPDLSVAIGGTTYASVDAYLKAVALGATGTVEALVPVSSGPAAADVISGSEEADGTGTTKQMQYVLYFDKTVGNNFQGLEIEFKIDVEAMQYRNNTNPTWTGIAEAKFDFGT